MRTRHTPAPWRAQGNVVIEARDGDVVCRVETFATPESVIAANARLIAAAPDLLRELEAAHQIIRNALNLMTVEQKLRWTDANERANLVEFGTTRAHEREAVIEHARNVMYDDSERQVTK